MKRNCTYCGKSFKKKVLEKHIFSIHHGEGAKFFCRDDCVRCCTDIGAPLELVLSDVERIAPSMGLSYANFFKNYGGILWNNIPGSPLLIPSIGLPFPCRLLKDGRCTIYDLRPLHCRLFPERLYVEPSPETLEPFFQSGYKCLDEGFLLESSRNEDVFELMKEDRKELVKTAELFRNEDFVYELTPSDMSKIDHAFADISVKDPERNRKKREIIEDLIPDDLKKVVEDAFREKLRKLDRQVNK